MTELSKEQRELMAKLLKQKGLDSKAVEKKDEIKVSCDANRRYEPYPLTDIQQSYLLGRSQSFVLGNVASHAYIEMDIQNLDIPRYEYAWQKIIQRHDMLRTVVYENGMQQTLETVPEFRVIEHDFSSLETQEQKEQAFLDLRKSLSHQVLPTDQWPLFNIHVSTMDKKHYKIHWSFDAIILDVYSNFIFQEELYHYYHDDNTHYEPLELTFRDYVLTLKEQEQSASYEASEQYWFKGLETLPSAPVLPLKNELSMIQKPHFERLRYAMDEHLWQGLKQKSKKYGVTTTSVLLTAFSHVLHKWGRNPDFTLNMTVFNRPAWHEQMDKIVGDFTITMLLGINALSNDDKRFNTLAKHIQSKLFSDLEHRLYSGVNVIQHWSRISGSKQIAPIVFTSALTVGDIGENLDTKSSQLGEISYSITQTPQVLLDHQVYEENGQLITNWDYVDEAFESSLLTCMFTMYTQTLELLASSESIWDEPLLIETPVSQQNQREQFNETHDEKLLCLSQKPLYYSFNEQVHIQPDAFAVVSSQKSLTYKELAYYAYEVNRKLQKQGVKVGDNVAIILPKGWQQTVAVLGILACGATYIPIDSKSPKLRLNKLLCDANCNHIITVESTFESLSLSQDIKTVFIKNEIEQMYPEALEFWPMHHTLKDTAYIIYTSGSTGQPKGVMMGHNAVMNTILDINHRFNITHEDSVFGLSALNFDLSVYDIFGTLSVGAKLVLPDEGQDKNPQHWQECLAKKSL
jgi:non-ribosomal peptide synthetase component F